VSGPDDPSSEPPDDPSAEPPDPSAEPRDPSAERRDPLVERRDPLVERRDPLVEPVETPPLLRVVTGDPTPEELAALVAVVASLGGPAGPAPRRTPVWNAPARLQRRVLRHGSGAWRASGLPSA